MMKHNFLEIAAACVAVAGFTAACVHKADEPALTGPSGLARSLSITATPDHVMQDGASQSSITALAIGPNGAPLTGVAIRFDTLAGGQLVDVGTLSARTAVTGSDGTARVTFTAPPPAAPPFDSTVNIVSVRAIPFGSDAQTTIAVSTEIALMPKGAILPQADTPTPQFLFFPTAPTVGAPVRFDASGSCPGAAANGVCAASNSAPITVYQWRFGDGGTATGVTADHSFSIAQKYSVTLIVTNNRGVSAGATADVIVTDGNPTAAFTASVQNALTHTMTFDGSGSTAVSGATIVSYQWAFGDGTFGGPSPSPTITHTYSGTGSFPVRLVVTDNLGRKSTAPATNVAVP